MDEHRAIESVMDALDAYVDGGHASAPQADLARFTTVLRDFADAFHHGKEEDILFASMVEHGFPRDGGPIGMMLHEHDEGRSHVRALAALANIATPWTADQRRTVASHARAFTSLLRAHIQKEDQILYPMALTHLPEQSIAEMTGRFDDFESRQLAEPNHPDLPALVEELTRRYGAAARLHGRAS
jgi:hemerythrin-like domain-containing protein